VNKEFDIKKRTLSFSKELLAFVAKLPKNDENNILKKQIIRSGTSIGANVYESNGGHSKKDFSNYINIALKSANETLYWFELIESVNKNLSAEIDILSKETAELTKILATIAINSRKD